MTYVRERYNKPPQPQNNGQFPSWVHHELGRVARGIPHPTVIDIRDFSPRTNGAADDSGAILRMLGEAGAAKAVCFLAGGSYGIGAKLTLGDHVVMYGAGREATRLVALSGFPADTPMVELGDDTGLVFGVRLEHMSLIGAGNADIGVYSEVMQEQSGLIRVHVSNVNKKCIYVASDAAQTFKAQNYLLRDLEVSLSTTSDSSAIAIHLEGDNNAGKIELANVTVNVAGGVTDVDGIGVLLDGICGHARNIHVEHVLGGGVVIGENSPCQALTIDGVEGHSTIEDLVRIGDTQNVDVTLTGIKRSGSTTTINDEFTGLSFTDDTIGLYHTGQVNSGGVPNYPTIKATTSSPAALAAGNNNDYALASARVGTLRLSGDAGGTSVITGIAGGVHGRELWVYNVSANNVGIAHADTNSLTANRINSPSGATVTLAVNDCALLRYDGISARWRLVNWQT